jgi:hypothetical protein
MITGLFASILIGSLLYTPISLGSKLGRYVNRKIRGKYSPFNEIVMVRSGSEITRDEWYCQWHKQWNWSDDECHCCAPEEGE